MANLQVAGVLGDTVEQVSRPHSSYRPETSGPVGTSSSSLPFPRLWHPPSLCLSVGYFRLLLSVGPALFGLQITSHSTGLSRTATWLFVQRQRVPSAPSSRALCIHLTREQALNCLYTSKSAAPNTQSGYSWVLLLCPLMTSQKQNVWVLC